MIRDLYISVKGERYPVVINTMGTAYLFCRKRGIEMWQFDKIFFDNDPEKLPTEFWENYAMLVIAGIENAMHEQGKEPPELEVLDIMNWMSEHPDEQEQVMAAFFGAAPQEEKKDDEQAKKKKKGLFQKS